ncbi:histidine phosphatase [Enterococcus florum]|uniref:Histidine phosphatase n=1 Tax=Enterococcus florum TaxID=2480627 RepID=A0A4P5PAT4_9ENTE|nr:histidine phosphatase family protein [Enterococcus florum]GCF95217.1 histidine phosphatase [Enterococcus florum]
MKIYLMRHGETDYNQQKLFYGMTDAALNSTGREQALQLKEKLLDLSDQLHVYTSTLSRTIETAELIFPSQKIRALSQLNEKGFGKWEGMNAQQIQLRFPREWQLWLDEPFEYTPPEAEEFASFKQRVLACFHRLLQEDKDLAIVGHLGVLRVLLSELTNQSFWEIELEQGNYTLLEKTDHGYLIRYWNQ